ncbi:pyrimidine-nucleoside phosphorylase [Mycoplasma sp. P36-A1]|uniref:pyrimidine-nucleoside phosphorylase n=1 Tax=Mycoplasma sp. P36-A1 TaxID=3252900 RepID=UPI003C2B52D8
MNILEIIEKKKNKEALTKEEIQYFIDGFIKGEIKDYQASALLMAIVINDMNNDEIVNLTNSMLYSGDIIDLSQIKGIKSDKHSTGGVGDKVTLVLAPLLASANATISKMSGRGLGHTGGTIDKLEAIPGFQVEIPLEEFVSLVNKNKIAIVGQTGNLVPADKKLYALRDVTGTVQSIPLIASSIMSKKLASGADTILLDVKVGKGAFMKDLKQAEKLSKTMVEIGKSLNKDVKAVITDMNQPLGYAIGNALEIKEVIDTLHGNGPKDLTEICLKLGAIMLVQAKIETDVEKAYTILEANLHNEKAFNKFKVFVAAQHGDTTYIDTPEKFSEPKTVLEIVSDKEGYLHEVNALELGQVALELGAGRHTKEDNIDFSAGIVLKHKINDYINKGDIVGTLYTNKEVDNKIIEKFKAALIYSEHQNPNTALIKEIIS